MEFAQAHSTAAWSFGKHPSELQPLSNTVDLNRKIKLPFRKRGFTRDSPGRQAGYSKRKICRIALDMPRNHLATGRENCDLLGEIRVFSAVKH